MLTCKLGESIINCFDGKYDRYRLKQWSNKKLLKCPVCNGEYEYCHGEVVSPYFRHVGKECDGYYGESESDEHRNGKLILYNWIKNNNKVTNCKLESWIPETKQRPDIYFEIDGIKFVIEFQCTPIASEFIVRRELYRLAGITDIWILGTEKYNIEILEGKSMYTYTSSRFKTIEKELDEKSALYYLDVNNDRLILNPRNSYSYSIIKHDNQYMRYCAEKYFLENEFKFKSLKYYYNYIKEYNYFNINDFIFESNSIRLDENIIKIFNGTELAISNAHREYREYISGRAYKNTVVNIISQINNEINNVCYKLDFSESKNRDKYLCRTHFQGLLHDYTYFISADKIDFCRDYGSKMKYNRFEKISEFNMDNDWYKDFEGGKVYDFIKSKLENIVKEESKETASKKERLEKTQKENYKIFNEFFENEIILIHQGRHSVPDGIKFKFLKGFSIFDSYMKETFISELKFLKRKQVDQYVFMIPKYHSFFNSLGFGRYVRVGDFNEVILNHFKFYGFKNVRFVNESEGNS